MTEISKTVRLKIGQWYAKNLLAIEPGFNAHFEKWNEERNECTVTFTCFDDYPDPRYRRSKDDLEEYIVRRFGSMVLSDLARNRRLTLASATTNLPISHPLIKIDRKNHPSLQDNYKSDYILDMTKEQLQEANRTLADMGFKTRRFKPEIIKQNSSYTPDTCKLRVGTW